MDDKDLQELFESESRLEEYRQYLAERNRHYSEVERYKRRLMNPRESINGHKYIDEVKSNLTHPDYVNDARKLLTNEEFIEGMYNNLKRKRGRK